MKSSWLLVLPILLFSVSAPAQWPDTKEKTERIFRDANLGDPKAQTYLGRMYDNGKGGVPLDHAEAAKWYRKAAEQGNQKAQWQLGRAYHKGQGVSLDLAEAEKWFRKAAEQGNAKAQDYLQRTLRSHESARQRENSETVTWSLFAGIAILALMTIAITKRLRIQTPGEDRGKKRSFLVEISYVLGFVFLFVPGVIWPLMAFPVAAVVPALMTLAVTLRGYWQSPTPGRRMALALIFISTSMWLCFGLYEHQLQKWAQSVVAPIRVDLVVLGPLLYISTLSLFRF